MGWWNSGILDGDTPLDCLGNFEKKFQLKKVFPLDEVADEDIVHLEDVLLENPRALVNHALTIDWCETSIAIQVAVALTMAAGAPLPDSVKKEVIPYILRDEWYNDGDERRQKQLDSFVETVLKYDGTPMYPDRTGLMETIMSAIRDGNTY